MKIVLKNGVKVEVRPMRPDEDVFEMTRFVNETRRTGPYLGDVSPVEPEKEAEWIQKSTDEMRKGRAVYYVATRGDKIVGITSAACKTGHCNKHIAEFGWMIRPGYRSIGLGSTMGRIVLRECVKKPKMQIIFSRVYSNNASSAHLVKKFQFKQIARLAGFYKRGKETCDELHLRLDKKRFKQKHGKHKA